MRIERRLLRGRLGEHDAHVGRALARLHLELLDVHDVLLVHRERGAEALLTLVRALQLRLAQGSEPLRLGHRLGLGILVHLGESLLEASLLDRVKDAALREERPRVAELGVHTEHLLELSLTRGLELVEHLARHPGVGRMQRLRLATQPIQRRRVVVLLRAERPLQRAQLVLVLLLGLDDGLQLGLQSRREHSAS